MVPGTRHQLKFSFGLQGFPPGGELLVTFFPLLVWDQYLPTCQKEAGSSDVSCEFQRAAAGLGYNQMRVRLLTDPASLEGYLELYVRARLPENLFMLPSELTAAVPILYLT